MALTQIKSGAIADDAIDSSTFADGSIDNAHLADDAVDSDEIAAGSVDIAHLAAGTDGKIITWDANGAAAVVGPGTDGQVLTSTGAGSPPAFEDAAGGVTLTGSTNNTIATITGADALQGEANLTFDGSTLDVTGDAEFSGTVTAADSITSEGQNTELQAKIDSTRTFRAFNDSGYIAAGLTNSGATTYEIKLRADGKIQASGDCEFAGSVKIGGTASANEIDEYEEGTFTIGFSHSGATITANTSYDDMYYTKIGRICHVYGHIRVDTVSGTPGTLDNMKITGLPFTVKSGAAAGRAGVHVTYRDASEATADRLAAQPWQFDEGTTNIELNRYEYGGFAFGDDDQLMISATYMVN